MDAHLSPPDRDLSVGTRICLLAAGLLVAAALYLLITPLERLSSQGPPFDCGTALAPAGGNFARGVCGDLNQRRLLQGGTVLLMAVLLAGGGRFAFGPLRRRRGSESPESPEPPGATDSAWSQPATGSPPSVTLPRRRREPEHGQRPAPPDRS
ncbi:MAG: hypothetical protein ACJ73E_00835 [Mycobacteriales bacterium]